MPRSLRIEYPGAIYHVMSRGDRREKIFLEDVDRQDFIKTLAEACAKTGWQVHAYCLMPNHYHIVLETPDANLVAGMTWLQSVYTIRFNHRHKLFGHVFSGRYKSQLVEGSGNGYLRTACDYVHLNPVRARMLKPEDRLISYPWSSIGAYAASVEHRPGWIRVDRLLGEHGIQKDNARGRMEFEEMMEERRLQEVDPEAIKVLQRGWCLGGPTYKREMLELMEGDNRENQSGEQKRETALGRAERILKEELKRRGWSESDMLQRRKNDPDKLEVAARLRRETTLTIKEIAIMVQLGTSKGANANLHRHMRQKPPGGAGAAEGPVEKGKKGSKKGL